MVIFSYFCRRREEESGIQETGDRRQETGDRIQNTEYRIQTLETE